VDEVDLRDLDPVSWRRRLAVIFQNFTRFELSAADNVTFGAVERKEDRAALERAARRAGAEGVISELPHGWDTILSRRYGGADLSGGQWQRLALARALFAVEAGAGVLVLDEPTASLDVRAEAELFERFLDFTTGLTTILISHRFSTVRRADEICLLEGGRVERGTHEELMAAGSRYARMYSLQAARFAEEPEASGGGGASR
jgi:ATP-binding cassette subfamily B protein